VLATLAMATPFHPVEDLVRMAPWDGVDHIKALARSVPTDSQAWPVYLRKWLVQMVEGVCGWRDSDTRQLPHVIVFSGDQGIGKGRWITSLLPASMVLTDAHLDVANKDDVIVALKHAVVELGEIDATFRKADISRLKSFLSRSQDIVREPYMPRPNSRPRMTSFIGSVNHEEFLSDVTGSRRFWPVAVREGCKLDWEHGVNVQQALAQALELWKRGEEHNLSEAEDELRQAESVVHQTVSVTVDLLEAHMSDLASAFPKYAIMNAGELLQSIGVRHASQPQRVEVSAWLKNNVGAARTLRSKQKSWCLPIGTTGLNASNIMSFQKVTDEYAKKVFGQYPHADRWVTEEELAAGGSEKLYH
jgi:putative DNA primase/helicase